MTGLLATVGVAQSQVVMDMPAPRVSTEVPVVVRQTPPEFPDEIAWVDVGEVAIYRYSSTRFYPRPARPRFYQQFTTHHLHSPFHFHGFFGRSFLHPPIKFQLRRPFPLEGFHLRVH